MRFIAVTLLCAGAALAQHVISVDNMPPVVNGFYTSRTQTPLPCTVTPIKPALNFSFQFQAGYELRISLGAYQSGKHHWDIMFRVTPKENPGQPVYFMDSIDLPPTLHPDSIEVTSGTFLVGEGRYDVKWSLLDDVGRLCRQQWTIDARLDAKDRSAQVTMPAGAVGDLSWRPASGASTGSLTKPRYITVLLNTALPVALRGSSSPLDQWRTLLTMLASLLERMQGDKVRLVVFNLDQQRELFREDSLTPDKIDRVVHTADSTERWAVDYHVLLKPFGGWDLLRDLENKEIRADVPADTVIFVGLPEASAEKMPTDMPGPERTTRFFYLKCGVGPAAYGDGAGPQSGGVGLGGYAREQMQNSTIPGPAVVTNTPDPIEQSVRHLNGKTIIISSPAGINKAIVNIEQARNR